LPNCNPIAIRVEVAKVQTNSQRRFTVVELPVFPIVKETLLMPLNFLPELVKFGWIPFTAILTLDLICFGLLREDVSRGVTGSLMTIAHFVLFTSFSVAWTKLTVRGRQAVARHPQFSYSRTQWFYLLANGVMMAALLVLVGMPYLLLRYGQRNFDNQISLLGETAAMLGLGIYAIAYVRLAFLFPAIAIGRYAGLRAAWKQTAGNFERLVAVIVLTVLPYWIIRQAFEWYMGYHPPGVVDAFRGCIDMLLVALATTALAGPALAYKILVLDQPKDDATRPANVAR
jgi:hypothetical protein